jgi:hypothetical protein
LVADESDQEAGGITVVARTLISLADIDHLDAHRPALHQVTVEALDARPVAGHWS